MTVTPADVVWLPATSVATAVSTCVPLATDDVVHETLYGAVVSAAPMATPSTRNCTFAIAVASDAVAGHGDSAGDRAAGRDC